MSKLKHSSAIFFATFSLSFLPSLSSAALEKSSFLKIAVVDVQDAILKTNDGQSARKKIEKEVSTKKKELLEQQNNLKKMQEEFEAQQAILSESDKATKRKEFDTKYIAFEQSRLSFDQEARQKEAIALQKIFQNIQTEIEKIAQQKKYDMVFDKSAAVLLYANNSTDITSEVVALYNSDHKTTPSSQK